jgi:hypothetical protein
MKTQVIRVLGFSLIGATALLVACATQPHAMHLSPPSLLEGFLLGLFHGFIATFSLIASIFTDVRIYMYPNAGFVYDLGFYLGIVGHGPIVIFFGRRR